MNYVVEKKSHSIYFLMRFCYLTLNSLRIFNPNFHLTLWRRHTKLHTQYFKIFLSVFLSVELKEVSVKINERKLQKKSVKNNKNLILYLKLFLFNKNRRELNWKTFTIKAQRWEFFWEFIKVQNFFFSL